MINLQLISMHTCINILQEYITAKYHDHKSSKVLSQHMVLKIPKLIVSRVNCVNNHDLLGVHLLQHMLLNFAI